MEIILWLIAGVLLWLWLLGNGGNSDADGESQGTARQSETDGGRRTCRGEDDNARSSDIEEVDTDLESIRQLQR